MNGRVPDAAGWWWFGVDPEAASPVHISRYHDDGVTLRVRVPILTFEQTEPQGSYVLLDRYAEIINADKNEPGDPPFRWLGPVASPCPEGRVRVEMDEGVARYMLDGEMSAAQSDGPYDERNHRAIEALRTALAKGAA